MYRQNKEKGTPEQERNGKQSKNEPQSKIVLENNWKMNPRTQKYLNKIEKMNPKAKMAARQSYMFYYQILIKKTCFWSSAGPPLTMAKIQVIKPAGY